MSVDDDIAGLNRRQRRAFRRDRLRRVGRFNRRDAGRQLEIEVAEIVDVDDHLDVYARAWFRGQPVGFGKNGTIETERFRFPDPRILVKDPQGNITRTYPAEDDIPERTVRFSEDRRLALTRQLRHAIKVTGTRNAPVERGSIGSTVSTFYPNAGSGTAPIDGWAQRSGVDQTLAAIIAGAGNNHNDGQANTNQAWLRASSTTNQYDVMRRSLYGFATGDTIPSGDDISAAVFSLEHTSRTVGLDDDSLEVVSSAPADEANLANGDYGNLGSTSFAQAFSILLLTLNVYTDYTLDAAGRAHIDKTAGNNTFYGLRLGFDLNGTGPTWASGAQTRILGDFADATGTTSDPKLVVTHEAGTTFQAAWAKGANTMIGGAP